MNEDPDTNGWTAWRELLRVANVFTAASNVIAGFAIARGELSPVGVLLVLVVASMFLYEAGMALNDGFDAELDSIERPERPIPSGRITRRAALFAGWGLMAGGVALAACVSMATGRSGPLVAAGCLAVMIAMYDSGLKATPAGPWAMGWCRMLNVLLGASSAANLTTSWQAWTYASAVGLYAVGITYLARSETVGTAAQMIRTRIGVTRLIQGFIVLDSIAATASAGLAAGLVVLALLAPTMWLARRIAMT